MTKFHVGEAAVQKQAGVEAMAARVGGGIHPYLFDGAVEFLQGQSLAVISSTNSQQQVWASLLTGTPGFLQTLDDKTLRIVQALHQEDPLFSSLTPGKAIGLIAIDFDSRLRLRVNGTVIRRTSDALGIETNEVYGNCQKYIQAREIIGSTNDNDHIDRPDSLVQSCQTPSLTQDQESWIASADTFFIASHNPGGGADVSHRGGNPGFVHVLGQHELVFPDYSGNMMFNTLGNIAVNPSAGLLFLDFNANRTLQLTGHATILWDTKQMNGYPGAKRLVKFQISKVIESRGNLRLRFGAPEYSRFNPH